LILAQIAVISVMIKIKTLKEQSIELHTGKSIEEIEENNRIVKAILDQAEQTNSALNEIIHDNFEAAKQVCKKYLEGIQALQEQLGVVEEALDTCIPETIVIAQYWDEKGRLKSCGIRR
jgi:hypothetical protein